jgi:trimethylamine:corrinoid methyltransferase-like protein
MESFLADVVYQHLCINRSQVSCFDNVLKYTNTFVVPENFNFTREQIMGFLLPTIREQARRLHKTRIFIADNVSSIAANSILALQNPGIIVIGDSVYVDPTKFDGARGVSELMSTLSISSKALTSALELRPNRNVDIVEKLDPEVALQVLDTITSQVNLAKQYSGTAQDEFILKNTFYRCLKLVDHSVRQYPE